MGIIIDLIIIGIFALNIFLGYQKGLTKCMIKVVSFFIALIVAVILFKPVSNFIIQNTEIDDTIKEAVVNLIGEDVTEEGTIKENTNLPKTMVNYINKTIQNVEGEVKNNVVATASEGLATLTVNVGVAIILFIIVRIALVFVSALSSFITDLPIIKQFDKTGGILYGALKSCVIILIILALISFISPMIKNTGLITAMNQSFIGSVLYNHNILLEIIF